MIALDTNVLVRYVVEDDAAQTAAAVAMIERAVERDEPLFVPQIVLCELVWVLSHAYRFNREEVVGVLLSSGAERRSWWKVPMKSVERSTLTPQRAAISRIT